MIITDISKQRKKDRYNLFVDGEFYSGIGVEALVKSGFKVGLVVNSSQLENAVVESESRLAFEKILNLISKKLYTKKDIVNKLKNYGFSADVINKSIEKAVSYGYINDNMYAKAVVESGKLKSRLELKKTLGLKGVDKDIIDQTVCVIDSDEEKKRAYILAGKYLKNKDKTQDNMRKLYAFLGRHGFGYETINCVFAKLKFDIEEE